MALVFVRNSQNFSENMLDEVYCPKSYPPKIFVLNVSVVFCAWLLRVELLNKRPI